MDLASHLGMSVGQVCSLSAAEVRMWRHYWQSFGFTADRIEWAIAIGSAHLAATWGSRLGPEHLIPRFGQRGDNQAAKIAGLSSVSGAQVSKGGRYGGK